MAFLPADLVSEILSWLPVEPLLRFRSVCMIWCSLIDSDDFIKFHLHRKNNRQLIPITHDTDFVDTISLDSLEVAGKLDYPLVPGKKGYTFLASCNGLLLSWRRDGDYTDIAISNPSTRKCHTLPPPEDKLVSYSYRWKLFQLCFGYDAINDDYKAVKFNYIKDFDDHFKWDVQVYSLKSNSWRIIKDFPYQICWWRESGDVLAQGALHFVVFTNSGEEEHHVGSIATFDLATEETRLVSLPDFGDDVESYTMDLTELEGCVCIVVYESDRKFLGLWVMKDNGAEKSWNKLLSAAQLSVMGSFRNIFPLVYSKNGCEVLLLQDFKLFIWYDLENNAVRKLQACSLPSSFLLRVFVQSLVPLGCGGKTNPEKQEYQIQTKSSKRRLVKRKCQILPPPEVNRYPPICCRGLGFGYDAVNDDYKVVILDRFKCSNDKVVHVYSLKCNSWKDFPYHPRMNGYSVLAHGALHFRVTINNEKAHHDCSIAAFDLATEETRLVPLPEFGGNSVYMNLVALEGCLSIVAYDGLVGLGSYRKFLGVWVMKDDGVGGSWNKLISAAQSSVTWSFGKVFPLVYSKNGREVLLLQDREFIWFDLENNAIGKIQVHGLPNDFRLRAQAFVQILIPPSSGGKTVPVHQLIRDKKEKHQEDIGMKRKRGVSEP